jgi:competence protein ComFC
MRGAPSPAEVGRCAGCERVEGFRRARSLVVFAEPARALTLALKRKGRRALAAAVGGLIADLAVRDGLLTTEDVIVTFVPAGKRANRAGFDHARLLAAATAATLGARMRPLLVRTTEGPRQADVPLAERRRNVCGRFSARPTEGSVLLVDDVFTTGATAEACSRALLHAGADAVDVVTWARTLRRVPRRGLESRT